MRSRYDGMSGKESAISNMRQRRLEQEHSQKNEFVKKVQNEQARHGGRVPNVKEESMKFNAYMCNDGEHAQELARDITAGMDKVAFPLK